jgi:hypothetical protein
MLIRALIVWLGILGLAFANGALREAALVPRVGDLAARAISPVMLAIAILIATWFTIGWIRPVSTAHVWAIGFLWLGLTLGFEFLAGHYIFGDPWSQLWAEYDFLRGRLWILVPVTTLLAPLVTAKSR